MDFFNVDNEKDAIFSQGQEEDFEGADEDILVIVRQGGTSQEVDADPQQPHLPSE